MSGDRDYVSVAEGDKNETNYEFLMDVELYLELPLLQNI
jgi:hypothetical protein